MAKEGESDDELAAKIESELQMETEMRDPEQVPISVKDYLENGPFELVDTAGQEEVFLTRKFGNETIRVSFSIADLNVMDESADPYEDPAMVDEEDSPDPQGSRKAAPEDSEEGEEGEQEERSFAVRVNVVITKPKSGALHFETVAQDGMIMVDNIFYYKDASLAEAKTADKAHERQSLYVGPPFSNLDEDLQVLMERYLDERGINATLALFVPDYIDMKEQKEYLRWLTNVQKFVEA